MRIALTGTPGTGKTTVAGLLPYRVIDVNSLVKGGMNLGTDPDRGCLDADMDVLNAYLSKLGSDETIVLEGHFSHHFADWSIVLRLSPDVLRLRLAARGYTEGKIMENLQAEALDVILVEAVEMCSRVDEIDTTGKCAAEVAELMTEVIQGTKCLLPGQVNWFAGFFGL